MIIHYKFHMKNDIINKYHHIHNNHLNKQINNYLNFNKNYFNIEGTINYLYISHNYLNILNIHHYFYNIIMDNKHNNHDLGIYILIYMLYNFNCRYQYKFHMFHNILYIIHFYILCF